MDEDTHLDIFFEVACSESFWNQLIAGIRELRAQSQDGGWLDGKSYEEAELGQRILFDLYRPFNMLDLIPLFERYLLEKFPFPPITAQELTEIASQQLAGASSDEEFRLARKRFIAHLQNAVDYNVDEINYAFIDVEIAGLFLPKHEGLGKLIDECDTLWDSAYGFSVCFNGKSSQLDSLKVDIRGKFTTPAFEKVSNTLKRVLPSASKSLHLVVCEPLLRERFSDFPFVFDKRAVSADIVRRGNGFFVTMIDYYFLPSAKKASSFEQRLRNAVHLLVEADAQANKAISLSLSFSAIEAMVCDKTDGIVDELSRHVAALLEPDSLQRPDAIAEVKQLYGLRSKTLHGDSIFEDDSALWRARMLAAAVLMAAFEWHAHIVRLGAQPNRADFIRELRTISATGQQMVGIPGGLSKYLPSSTKGAVL